MIAVTKRQRSKKGPLPSSRHKSQTPQNQKKTKEQHVAFDYNFISIISSPLADFLKDRCVASIKINISLAFSSSYHFIIDGQSLSLFCVFWGERDAKHMFLNAHDG